jgi:hypothetical protein
MDEVYPHLPPSFLFCQNLLFLEEKHLSLRDLFRGKHEQHNPDQEARKETPVSLSKTTDPDFKYLPVTHK